MPDFDERRIAYHSDGTMVFLHRSRDNGNDVVELETTAKEALNSELDAGVYFTSDIWSWTAASATPDWLIFFFPIEMNLKGIYNGLWEGLTGQMKSGAAWPAGIPASAATYDIRALGYSALFEYSEDSTNGYDGTWQSLGVLPASSNSWPDDGQSGSFVDFFEISNRNFSGAAAAGKVPIMEDPRTYYWPIARQVTRGSTDFFTEFGSEVSEYYPDNVRTLRQDYDPVTREGVHRINARRVRALRMSLSASGIPATWLKGTNVGMKAFIGLFGDAEQTDDNRLELRDRNNDSAISPEAFAWGDIVPSDSEDRSFRIKNTSTSSTAIDIRIRAVDTVVSQLPASQLLLFSRDDGRTWEPEVALGSLGPGSVSRTIMVRLISQEDWPSGHQSVWVSAEAEEWL